MTSTDRFLSLAKSIIPSLAIAVFAIVKVGAQGGMFVPFLVPFLFVAAIGVVQAVRSSGVINGFRSRKKLRGSVADTAHRGRSVADELLRESRPANTSSARPRPDPFARDPFA